MRELQVYLPTKRKPIEVVRRLEFRANGAELVASCGMETAVKDGRTGFTNKLHVYDFMTDSVRELFADWFFYESSGERTPDPVISPNRELIAFEHFGYDDASIFFEELAVTEADSRSYPSLLSCPHGMGGLVFTRDGAELIAVRNLMENGTFAPDIVRFTIASLFNVLGFEEKINPFNGKPYQARIYDVRWQESLMLPRGERLATVGLSADDRLLVVGGNEGVLHVADLEQKNVLASFPWEGRKLRDRAAVRVAFSPEAKWVVMLANGRLFARARSGKVRRGRRRARWATPTTLRSTPRGAHYARCSRTVGRACSMHLQGKCSNRFSGARSRCTRSRLHRTASPARPAGGTGASLFGILMGKRVLKAAMI